MTQRGKRDTLATGASRLPGFRCLCERQIRRKRQDCRVHNLAGRTLWSRCHTDGCLPRSVHFRIDEHIIDGSLPVVPHMNFKWMTGDRIACDDRAGPLFVEFNDLRVSRQAFFFLMIIRLSRKVISSL